MGDSFPIRRDARWGRVRPITAAAWLWMAALFSAGHAPAQTPPGMPARSYTGEELDQMLAPIALYPDGLLGQILMAATYPLEIVEADRWLQDPNNAALRGAQLVQALQQQQWDPSVKSLVAFPQVLGVLDGNLDWTEQVGEAFLAQQRDVMDHVQQLRNRAEAARTLISTPQQVVTGAAGDIEIAPADADTLYVPVYDPNLVFGAWPDPDAPPYYFDMAGYFPGAFVGFVIVAPLWGWNQCDWRNHGLVIATGGGGASGAGRPPMHHVPWRHDPAHRGGVRYVNNALEARYSGAVAARSPTTPIRGNPPERLATPPMGYPGRNPTAPAPQNAAVLPERAHPFKPAAPGAFAPALQPPAQAATPDMRGHPFEPHATELRAPVQRPPESHGAEPRAPVHESANPNGAKDRR